MNRARQFHLSQWQARIRLAVVLGILTNNVTQLAAWAANAAPANNSAGLTPPPAGVAVQSYPRLSSPSTRGNAPPPPHPKAKAEDTAVLQSSRPIIAPAPQWQQWTDYLKIKAGQDHVPLTLTFENAGFLDLRIKLAGRTLASIKDFKGQPSLILNLTEAVSVGESLLTIQGYGPTGARLSWKLSTPKPVASEVKPSTFGLADKVVVNGKNFAESASADQVTIGGKTVKVTSARKDQLTLQLPSDLPGGKQDLIVTVGTIRCNPLQVTLKVAPEVSSVNYISTAPGQPVVVSGKGFSTKASDNEIMFGGVPATITEVSATSISCIVPDLPFPQWYVPITVKTNGVDSTGTVTINLQQRVIENQGIPEQ